MELLLIQLLNLSLQLLILYLYIKSLETTDKRIKDLYKELIEKEIKELKK